MKFVNREKEIKFLKAHFASEPNSLLFIYGPKSSGKTALLYKVINELDLDRFTVNYLNLREVLIYNFNSFLDVFFPKNLYGKIKDVMDGISFNIGFFGINVEDEKTLKQNAFKIMGDKLRNARKRNKQPIIIIDEIQLLKNHYVNGERYLIDELFNLFISLTKQNHIAHVILATSDSYYIEEIYRNAKLMKTSELFFIDHFDKNTLTTWLKDENINDDDIEYIWNNIGGCPWEISQLINKKNNGLQIKDICRYFVDDEYAKIYDYIFRMVKDKEILFYEVIKNITKKGCCYLYEISNRQLFDELIKEMVSHDYWFYKVDEQKITANSQSLLRAFERMT